MFLGFRQFYSKYRELITYGFFGVLTTFVNFAVYYPLYIFLSLPAYLCNALAWLAAVVFAFIVNKIFVFCSKDWSAKMILLEGFKFAACRVVSGLLETVFLFLLADVFDMNGNLWKIIVSGVVIVLNYVGSKFLVFVRKER